MGEVVQFPNTGTNFDPSRCYNPADRGYWKEYCGELDAKQIDRIVSKLSGYTLKELRKQDRKSEIVDIRQLFVLLCLKHTTYSYSTIGAILNRDHTSIMNLEKREQSFRLKKLLERAEEITNYLTTT